MTQGGQRMWCSLFSSPSGTNSTMRRKFVHFVIKPWQTSVSRDELYIIIQVYLWINFGPVQSWENSLGDFCSQDYGQFNYWRTLPRQMPDQIWLSMLGQNNCFDFSLHLRKLFGQPFTSSSVHTWPVLSLLLSYKELCRSFENGEYLTCSRSILL